MLIQPPLATGACAAAGLGYHVETINGATVEKWDAVSNVDILGVELGGELSVIIRCRQQQHCGSVHGTFMIKARPCVIKCPTTYAADPLCQSMEQGHPDVAGDVYYKATSLIIFLSHFVQVRREASAVEDELAAQKGHRDVHQCAVARALPR